MKRKVGFWLIMCACLAGAQANTWVRASGFEMGNRAMTSLVYVQETDLFFSSLGSVLYNVDTVPYSEIVFSRAQGRWINYLPHDSLYGKWADSTGKAYGLGKCLSSMYSPAYRFYFAPVAGYLRPNSRMSPYLFNQYAYDNDNKKVYYYVNNLFFRYDIMTRRWDTLSTGLHPAVYQGGNAKLIWGAMCYDPHNREIVLFGGSGVDAKNGHCGTWTYKPATNTWTPLNLSVEPPPRAYSPMVYDAKNNCIVLFGGDHLDYLHSDTWIYDCATRSWMKKNPARAPSPRAGHALVYLPRSRKVVMLGGFNYSTTTSTGYPRITPYQMWTYDPAADEWALLKTFAGTATDTFPNQYRTPSTFVAASDTGDRILAVSYHPGFYTRNDAGAMMLECDPSVQDVAGTQAYSVGPGATMTWNQVYDPAWFRNTPAAPADSMENVLRTLPLDTWVRMLPPKTPRPNRDWGTRVYDPDHDQILVWAGGHSCWGGNDVPQYSPKTNRWLTGYVPELMLENNGAAAGPYPLYTTFSGRPFMNVHTYDNYAYSTGLKKMVYVDAKYTYLYDPVKLDWDTARILNHPDLYDDQFYACMTATIHGVVCWTGINGASSFGLFRLNEDSLKWEKYPISGLPNSYSDQAGAVYDSRRDQLLMVSNRSGDSLFYLYDFKTNTAVRKTVTGPYPSGRLRESVYLPFQDKVLFTPGNIVYNCSSQVFQPITLSGQAPAGSISSGWMYDPNRDLVYVVEQNCEVYAIRLSGGSTETEKRAEALSIKELSVSPNPFNPVVAIRVPGVRAPGERLRVYGPDGVCIADLTPLLKNSRVLWNGSGLASGIYVLRHEQGKSVFNKRVFLIR